MISDQTQTYHLRYADPYFLDSNWHFGIEGFSSESYYVSFIDRRQGGSLTLGRRLPHLDNVRFYATYSYLTTDLKGFDTDTIYRKQPSNADIGRLSLILDRNALNNNIDPTDGTRQRAEVQLAGYGMFGGSYDFTKTNLQAWYFEPVYRGSYLAFKSRLRLMNFNQDDQLLISERYFLGGNGSLRGYEVAAVGPRFKEDDGSLTPIGGNKDFFFTVEYIVPLSEELGMKIGVFYDAGNVYNDYEDMDLGDLRQDWGVSLRWMSPMGPLSFGMAFPIDPEDDDDPQQFVFSMGGAL